MSDLDRAIERAAREHLVLTVAVSLVLALALVVVLVAEGGVTAAMLGFALGCLWTEGIGALIRRRWRPGP